MDHGVRAASAAFAEALCRGDASGAAALYAADGRLLTAAAELISGRREIEAYWRAGIGFGLSAVELDASDVQIVGSLAIEVGRYVLGLAGDGPANATDCGKYLVLHRRQPDGSWRRAIEVFNPDAPEQAHPEPKEKRC